VLARLRISVPDRPGSLGRVTSAIGSAGGDIAKLDVLESEAGRALDDVYVQVRDAAHLSRLAGTVGALAGVVIQGVQHPAPPATGHTELELVQQVLSQPGRSLQTLVDGAPGALGADWAALIEYGADGAQSAVLATSTRAPKPASEIAVSAPLRLGAVRVLHPRTGEPYDGAALVPLTGTNVGLLLIREAGVDFHRSELWRFGPLGAIVGPVVTAAAV
jgi:ACT domain